MKIDLDQISAQILQLSDAPVVEFRFSQLQVFWLLQNMMMATEHPAHSDRFSETEKLINHFLEKADLPEVLEDYIRRERAVGEKIQVLTSRFLISGLAATIAMDRLVEITGFEREFWLVTTAVLANQIYDRMSDQERRERLMSFLDYQYSSYLVCDQVIDKERYESPTN